MKTRDVVIIMCVAAVLRFSVYAVSARDPIRRQREPDSNELLELGKNLSEGKGFGWTPSAPGGSPPNWIPEILRLPGYPLAIAAGEVLTGDGQAATIVLQNVLGVGLCIAVALVCGRMFGRRAGLAAGLLLALDLQGIALNSKILTASLYGFILFPAALLTARILQKPNGWTGLAAGLLLGLSALVRPTSVALPAAAAVVIAGSGVIKRRGRLVLAGILVGISGTAVIAGWAVRNGQVAGEYTYSPAGRANFLFGLPGSALARSKGVPKSVARKELEDSLGIGMHEMAKKPVTQAQSKAARRLAWRIIWDNKSALAVTWLLHTANIAFGPDKYVLSSMGLPWMHFGLLERGGPDTGSAPLSGWLLLGAQALWLLLVYAMALRTIIRRVRGGPLPGLVWVCLGFFLYVVIISTVSVPDPRYRWPVIPLLVVMGAASLSPKPKSPNGAENAQSLVHASRQPALKSFAVGRG